MSMDRRSFLKLGAAGAGAAMVAGLSGCSQSAGAGQKNNPDIEWEAEADVVVVGGGGTGYAAALEALRAGSTVIVLEKSPAAGGNTRLSAGMILSFYPELQKELSGWWEGADSVEKYTEEMLSWGCGLVDEDKIRELCETSTEELQWMLDMGRTYDSCDIIPPVHGFDTEDTWAPRSFHNVKESTGHFDIIHEKAMEFEGIKEEVNTEATHLVLNGSGEVIGVEAEKKGRTLYYKAKKGVLIATAGPDFGKDLTRTYNRQMYWGTLMCEQELDRSKARGSVLNTGDGIRMGLEIGADVEMSQSCVMSDCWSFGQVSTYGIEYPEPNMYRNPPRGGAIYVNQKGNRFVQEDAQWGFLCSEIYHEIERSGTGALEKEPNVFVVTDHEHLPNFTNMGIGIDPDKEVSEGTLFRADSLEELAELIGLESPRALKETVERYNRFCEAGEDLDFHRVDNLEGMTGGPYYAMRTRPIVMGAAGGLAINIETQVLDTAGNTIPRLYAGGMASGGWIGPFYNACGWAVLGTVHWGRKAGRNISALEPWE
ncbi:FAD-dependent oxidoreductase [Raoultibacter timonensis]|uniref:FAD-dependent oxidoreductase n=1 Tax=Raoultibacter timonensis TaxID=1907662 RepID=UPI0015E1B612|nr:FAD-dependent oxidoreductase [Raoultibacter timonensis]